MLARIERVVAAGTSNPALAMAPIPVSVELFAFPAEMASVDAIEVMAEVRHFIALLSESEIPIQTCDKCQVMNIHLELLTLVLVTNVGELHFEAFVLVIGILSNHAARTSISRSQS
jgi:hypothetical protein